MVVLNVDFRKGSVFAQSDNNHSHVLRAACSQNILPLEWIIRNSLLFNIIYLISVGFMSATFGDSSSKISTKGIPEVSSITDILV